MRSVSFVTSPAADARNDPLVSLLISLGCDGARFAGAEPARGTAAAKKYEDQAAKDKTRYEKEKAAYEAKK